MTVLQMMVQQRNWMTVLQMMVQYIEEVDDGPAEDGPAEELDDGLAEEPDDGLAELAQVVIDDSAVVLRGFAALAFKVDPCLFDLAGVGCLAFFAFFFAPFSLSSFFCSLSTFLFCFSSCSFLFNGILPNNFICNLLYTSIIYSTKHLLALYIYGIS